MSSQKCPDCGLVNWIDATDCKRCGAPLAGAQEAEEFLPQPQVVFEGEKPARALGVMMIVWGALLTGAGLYLLSFGPMSPVLVGGPAILITGIFVTRGSQGIFGLYFLGVVVMSVWLGATNGAATGIGSFLFPGLVGLLVARRRLPVLAGVLMGLSCFAVVGTLVFAAVMLSGAKVAWRDFRPAEGFFTVQMPSEPIAHDPMKSQVASYTLTKHAYESRVLGQGSTLFVVVEFTPPVTMQGVSIDKLLEAEVDALVQKVNGTIVSKRSINLGGYSGMEFEMRPPENLALASPRSFGRVFLNSEHEYMMVITGSESSDLLAGKDMFLNPQFSYRSANQPGR